MFLVYGTINANKPIFVCIFVSGVIFFTKRIERGMKNMFENRSELDLVSVDENRLKTMTRLSDTYWKEIIDCWIIDCQLTTPKSEMTYYNALMPFLRYIVSEGITNLADLRSFNLRGYYNWLDAATYTRGKKNPVEKKFSVSIKRLYFSVARSFCKFLTSVEILVRDISVGIRNFKRESDLHAKEPLSTNEVKGLLNNARAKAKTLTQKRNAAIIALMSSCGLRACEICRADVSDLRRDRQKYFLFVLGKGRTSKKEKVEVPTPVLLLIDTYLAARGNVKDDEPLFKSQKPSKQLFNTPVEAKDAYRISPCVLSRILKNELRDIGIDDERKTGHSLRHFAADCMISNGVGIRDVQRVLRHRNLVTTEIYLSEHDRYELAAESKVAAAIGLDSDYVDGSYSRKNIRSFFH